MMEGYKIVGVLNLFNLYPAFLFPIYQQGEKLFFHNGKKNRIYNFELITESVRTKIVYLDSQDIYITNAAKRRCYKEYEEPVYAFQKNENEIFCSNLVDMIDYLRQIKTNDVILRNQIENFFIENISEYIENIQSKQALLKVSTQHISKYDNEAKNTLSRFLSAVEAEQHVDSSFTNRYKFSIEESEKGKIQIGLNVISKEADEELLSVIQNDMERLHLGDRKNNLIEQIRRFNRQQTNSNALVGLQPIIQEKNLFILKKEFDEIIKRISYMLPVYDECIKCQNAIIQGDEAELIWLININYQLFQELEEKGIIGEYLRKYIRSHIYQFIFENI